MATRYAVDQLLERIAPDTDNTVSHAAVALGISRHTIYSAQRRGGLSERQADDWAVRAGFHPSEIWTDWFDTYNETRPTTMTTAVDTDKADFARYSDCPCANHLGPIDKAQHDMLVTIEARGAAGFADLIELVDGALDQEADRSHLRVVDLPMFVQLHDWQDESAMLRSVLYLWDLHRNHRRNSDTSEELRWINELDEVPYDD